jgi:magnesium-transporting ATPase (P-type)
VAVGDPLDKAALAFSGWRYDQLSSSYYHPGVHSSEFAPSEPVRLWQIRSFPFDPTRRLSSAIVLVQLKDQSFQLWKLMKGSPETMKDLFNKDVENFDARFGERTQEHDMQGYRSIAMGAENVSNSTIRFLLFPNELSAEHDSLNYAISQGLGFHRNDIETPSDSGSALLFCGFCCFDASVRTSSRRVINELNRGGINTVMLTGDSVEAALFVARKVNMIRHRNIAVLETSTAAETGTESLVWRRLRTKVDDDGSFRILRNYTKVEPATLSSSIKLVKRHEMGRLSFAANGRALELVLNGHQNDVHRLIGRSLPRMAVIARATPDLKKSIIDSLKFVCGRQVMMCGK